MYIQGGVRGEGDLGILSSPGHFHTFPSSQGTFININLHNPGKIGFLKQISTHTKN